MRSQPTPRLEPDPEPHLSSRPMLHPPRQSAPDVARAPSTRVDVEAAGGARESGGSPGGPSWGLAGARGVEGGQGGELAKREERVLRVGIVDGVHWRDPGGVGDRRGRGKQEGEIDEVR